MHAMFDLASFQKSLVCFHSQGLHHVVSAIQKGSRQITGSRRTVGGGIDGLH